MTINLLAANPSLPDRYDVLYLKNDGTGNQFSDSSMANPKTVTRAWQRHAVAGKIQPLGGVLQWRAGLCGSA